MHRSLKKNWHYASKARLAPLGTSSTNLEVVTRKSSTMLTTLGKLGQQPDLEVWVG